MPGKPRHNPKWLPRYKRKSHVRLTVGNFIDDDIEVEIKTSMDTDFLIRIMKTGLEIYIHRELLGSYLWDDLCQAWLDRNPRTGDWPNDEETL